MNTTIKSNKPIVYAVYKNEITPYVVLMETEQSYFVRRFYDSGRYHETTLEKSSSWVTTEYEKAVEILNQK